MTASHTYTRTKLACYTTNISMSVVGNLSPILFLTFHNLYDISHFFNPNFVIRIRPRMFFLTLNL